MNYLSWRISFQDSEQAARRAFDQWQACHKRLEMHQDTIDRLEGAIRDIIGAVDSIPELDWEQVKPVRTIAKRALGYIADED